MTDKINQKMPAKGSAPTWREEWVPESAIVQDKRLQARTSIHEPTVRKYAEQAKNGATFDPIKLARVKQKGGTRLYVVDGFHRLKAGALQLENWNPDDAGRRVLAHVADMTWRQAQWEAGRANMNHGLPLKRGDMQKVFCLFVSAHRPMLGWSYERIAQELNTNKTNAHRWMTKHFPAEARLMAGAPDEFPKDAGGPRDVSDEPTDAYVQAMTDLQTIRATAADWSPAERYEAAGALARLKAELEALGAEPEPAGEF